MLKNGLTTIVVLLVAGCGDSSIASSDTLDEIGAAGFERLCEEARDRAIDMYSSSLMTQFVCVADSVGKSSTAKECAILVDECRSNPPASALALLDQILAQAGCDTVSIEPTGCDLSVSQVDRCLDAVDSEIDRLQFTGSCAAAGQPVDDGWWQLDVPAECSSIDQDC